MREITYLYAEKNRGAIIVSSMRLFTEVSELKKHLASQPSYVDSFVWSFTGGGGAALISKKALEGLLK